MKEVFEISEDGTFVLENTVKLPDILDLLIVGGGPAGTATAFRAKELDIQVLVIDSDDLMKRIRDYSKDKLIYPDFGGGDKMRFPKGGELIESLQFAPTDKDDMCVQWKRLFQKNNIPAKVGIELTGIERQDNEIWEAKAWNHNTKTEESYRAKHIVLALGRGVPRRFDIPGNTEGIAFRLTDSKLYVGGPVCVIGGGTSAAEAVIAISNAKMQKDDPSAIYWSYRGDRMPKVSKALSEVFFEAFVGNGNIRYYPSSEPVAIVTAEDRQEYLAIRVDRKIAAGRPNETAHLEFLKQHTIACIGEDVPEAFLNAMEIYLGTGGPRNKKRMLVTPLLETQQPNIYLAGDILSQAYFETEDFDAEPSSFRETRHRGNIKTALRDGVLIAEVVKQRLEGKTDIRVVIEDVEETKVSTKMVVPISVPVDTEAPPLEAEPSAAGLEEEVAWIVRVLPGGVEENEYPLKKSGITTIGRKECDVSFPEDTLLSDQHASISHGADGYFLRDDGSKTGVFFRVPEGRYFEITPRDIVRAGKQFLVFGTSDDGFFVTHFDHQGLEVSRHELSDGTIVLGRKAPGVTLDPNDMTLSRRHLAISVREGRLRIKDLESINGTHLKVRDAIQIRQSDQFKLGRQAFTFSLRDDVALDSGHLKTPSSVQPLPAETVGKTGEAAPEKVPKGAVVTFQNVNKTFPIETNQTICELAEANGISIIAECHDGVCGSDPIRIISGKQDLSEPQPGECETLEDICELEPGEYRMACVARVKGKVVVEILEE